MLFFLRIILIKTFGRSFSSGNQLLNPICGWVLVLPPARLTMLSGIEEVKWLDELDKFMEILIRNASSLYASGTSYLTK